jgi:hypothetical protein
MSPRSPRCYVETKYDEQREQLDATGEAFFPESLLPPTGPAAFRSAAYAWGRKNFKRVSIEQVKGGWMARVVPPASAEATGGGR